MKTLHICFYVTATSSVLSLEADFEKKYQSVYKNFASFLYEKPNRKLSIAFSGPLISWLSKEHSEYTQFLSKILAQKQTELLGGGYYNPIFPLIFPQDRTGQIDLMTGELRRCVGKRPRGMTIFDSIWDNSLVPCFQSCGMEYVLLDSSLIPKERQCYLPLLVSEQGKSLSVLPVSREFIPNTLIEPKEYLRNLFDTINYLTKDDSYNSLTSERLVTIKIDENQFSRLHDSKWLTKLFASAQEYFSESIKITTPLEYLHLFETRIPSYIPSGIQSDVAKWAKKPYEEYVGPSSVQPTIFDFLLTYPQNKALYDRMLYISLLINQCRGDKARRKVAREKLWMAQNGEGYICDPDGVFANNAMRQHAYRSLTETEKLVRESQGDNFKQSVSSYDYNGDGFNEYVCSMNQFNACISLHGAQICELDIIRNMGNYADSPRRIKQFDKIDDKYHRGIFIDHLFTADEFAEYKKGNPTGTGIFSQVIFRQEDFNPHRHEIKLSGSGLFSPIKAKVNLIKKYIVYSDSFTVNYILKNESPFDIRGVFVVESNYAQTDFSSVKSNSYRVDAISNGEKSEIEVKDSPKSAKKITDPILITDTSNDISFVYDPNDPCDIVCMPVFYRRPSSSSDSLTISGNSFAMSLCWNVELEAGKTIEKNITYSLIVPKKGKK